MVAIAPKPQVTPEQAFASLQAWYGKKQQLSELKTQEILERKFCAQFYFPTPEEGTQRLPLGGGYDLKLVHKINRSVDEAALGDVPPNKFKELGIDASALFPMKPVLGLAYYRTLTLAQQLFVDALLDIDDGTPDLAIVEAAKDNSQYTGQQPITEAEAEAPAPLATIPAAAPSSAAEFSFAPVAEQATLGQYYTADGATFFVLGTTEDGSAYEWQEPAESADELRAAYAEQMKASSNAGAPAKKAATKRAPRKGKAAAKKAAG